MGNPFVWFDVEKKTTLNSWEIESIKARMIQYPANILSQQVKWVLEIKKGNKKIKKENISKIIFPEEFKTIIKLHGKFKVQNIFGDFKSSKFKENSDRMIVVLKRS